MLSNEQISSLYEISMNIGTSLNIDEVIKDATNSYLKKLNCSGVMILEQNINICDVNYTKPKNILKSEAAQKCVEFITKNCEELDSIFNNEEYHIFKYEENIYYIFKLNGFGTIVLIKRGTPLTENLCKALVPLNNKLSRAIFTCLQTTKLVESEKLLHQQAKMADMGEMIGNIAHQWRQPLSAISSMASSIKLNQLVGTLTPEDIDKNMNSIIDKTNYLSKTIDTFRNFIKETKELKEVILEDRIAQSINIVSASLEDNYIELIDKVDYSIKTKIMMVAGELNQVIINIFNNAKDILTEKNIQKPWVKIDLIKSSDNITISIEDNGGGIPEDIMPRIFEPYFTTKHQSQGTGLGLHMSYDIVTKSLKGELYVKNTKNGAKFFIVLPI